MKNLIEIIDRYLTGEMSPTEKAEFEAQVNQDPKLKKELDTFRSLSEKLASDPAIPLIQTLSGIRKKKPTSRIRPLIRWASAAAAFLIIGIAVGRFIAQPPSANHLFESNFDPPRMTTTQMGGQADSLLALAESRYNAGAFRDAYEALADYLREMPQNDEARYFAGLAATQAGNSAAAIGYFTQLIQKKSLFIDDARWNLALVYIRKEKWEEARQELLQLAGTSYAEQATKLTKKLP